MNTAVLRAARQRKGLKQRELAEAVGVHVRVVQSWEYGTKTPSLKNLVKLADVLELDLNELAGRN